MDSNERDTPGERSSAPSHLEQLLQDGSAEPEARLALGADEGSAIQQLSQGTPARPLLGRLPLARVVPQDVHSVMDYASAFMVLAGVWASRCPKAKTASVLLGGAGLAASSVTDYRLSLAKWIPIEQHEVIDYAFAASSVAAPFVFGYYKTSPKVALSHVLTGVGTLLTALFTDYRGYTNAGRSSLGGVRAL